MNKNIWIEQSANAIVLICRSQAKPQKLSLTYECNMKLQTEKIIAKSKELQKLLSVTQNRVQFSLRVVRWKCHAIG